MHDIKATSTQPQSRFDPITHKSCSQKQITQKNLGYFLILYYFHDNQQILIYKTKKLNSVKAIDPKYVITKVIPFPLFY